MNKVNSWSTYWNSTQALGTYGENVGKLGLPLELENFWLNQFNHLSKNKISVLDVGTGNGVIPLIALSSNNSNYFDICAVDFAKISPLTQITDRQRKNKLSKVSFYPETSVEDLPFSANNFDLITSNFAIEYADLSKALAEVYRVLNEKGKFVAVLHSNRGTTYKYSSEGVELFDRIFAGLGIENRLEKLILNKDNNRDVESKQLFNEILTLKNLKTTSEYQEWFVFYSKPIGQICLALNRPDFSLDVINSLLKNFVSTAKLTVDRLKQQLAASETENKITKLVQAINFRKIEVKPFSVRGSEEAILLQCEK